MEKKQFQDESIKLKHLLDQAIDQQMQTGNSTENIEILQQKYIQDNEELIQIQQMNEEMIQKLQEYQIVSQSHQVRLAKVINISDDLKKKIAQKDAQIQKLKTDCEIIFQEKLKQQEQFEKAKPKGNSVPQQPKRIQSGKRQNQEITQILSSKDQEIFELEAKYKQIQENQEIFLREQKIIEKQESFTKNKILQLKEQIQKQKALREKLQPKQYEQKEEKQEFKQQQNQKQPIEKETQKQQQQVQNPTPSTEQQQQIPQQRKKQKDIELEKRMQQRQKIQQQQQEATALQQQQSEKNQLLNSQKNLQQQQPIENEIIMERDQEQTEDFEQLEMQQQIQDSLKFLGKKSTIKYLIIKGEDIKYRLILNNIPQNEIPRFFYNDPIEAKEETNIQQLQEIFASPPFSLESDALLLLCSFLISDQFPIDFENIEVLKETREKVYEKLAFLISDYEILDKENAKLLKQNFTTLINQEAVNELFKQLQQQEEQLFKYDIQAGLKQFDIEITEKELDFIMVEILSNSGKQSLADLQFNDMFATFSMKTKQKGKKKKKKQSKKQYSQKQQSPDEARYVEDENI